MGEIEELEEYLNLTDWPLYEKKYIIAQAELIYQIGIKEGLKRGKELIGEILK